MLSQERDEAVKVILTSYKRKIRHRSKHHLGYPLNQDLDYAALEDLNQFSINNLGDPFIESNYGVHSREFEVGENTSNQRVLRFESQFRSSSRF